MIYLISPEKKQYKANLHCHSVLSDGKKTPEELKAMYKAQGYSVLSITDHERPAQHLALSDADFLMITGYECYIRPALDGKFDRFEREVHLNLFARDPMNLKMICYNEPYCRYVARDNALDTLQRAGSERQREYTREYINDYIRTAREYGYLVAHNHAYWSMEDEADILGYEGLFSMEMCNYSSYLINGLEYNGALYDKLLSAGKRIFCHGTDDNHNVYPEGDPNCDSFGSFTMIMPEEFTYDGIISAMEQGNMYASMGPQFHEVSLEGDSLHIACSEVEHIFVYMGSKKPQRIHVGPGQSLTSADLKVDPEARYVRVSIRDGQGRWADTRGFSREELGFAPL